MTGSVGFSQCFVRSYSKYSSRGNSSSVTSSISDLERITSLDVLKTPVGKDI